MVEGELMLFPTLNGHGHGKVQHTEVDFGVLQIAQPNDYLKNFRLEIWIFDQCGRATRRVSNFVMMNKRICKEDADHWNGENWMWLGYSIDIKLYTYTARCILIAIVMHNPFLDFVDDVC